MILLPPDLLPFFTEAGWYDERKVAFPNDFIEELPESHPAIEILCRFGGLDVGETEAGQECARDDVAFLSSSEKLVLRWRDFKRDSRILRWEGLLNTELVLVARVHHDHGELYVDSQGRCFGLSQIHDAFYFEGESFTEAMRRSMFGIRSRPMLRPDQESVTLYGIRYDAQSPELYHYE